MRVAIVCSKYAVDEKSAWLTNDLAYAYQELGCEVVVYCLAWSGDQPSTTYIDSRGINVFYIQQPNWQQILGRKLGLAAKWFFSSWWAATKIKVPNQEFDVLIYFSPAVTTAGIVRKLKKYSKKAVMILWDFFPQYHQELNLLPNSKLITSIAKHQEQCAVNQAHIVGLMSPENVNYMNKYFDTPSWQRRIVIPLWGPMPLPILDLVQKMQLKKQWPNLSSQRVWAVMGGQMIAGRGLELLLNVAALSAQNNNVDFIVAGDGVFKSWFLGEIKNRNLGNVIYVGSLSRENYYHLLQAADIGLVFNSGHVSVPTFASKSIDYLRAALPMVLAIESASDAGVIVEEGIKAGYNCNVTNPQDVMDKILYLAKDSSLRKKLGLNGYNYFIGHMTAQKVAGKILSELSTL